MPAICFFKFAPYVYIMFIEMTAITAKFFFGLFLFHKNFLKYCYKYFNVNVMKSLDNRKNYG